MKATGIVRRVDELGRVVLPKELRDVFNIEIRDSLEIYVQDDKIILKKYEPACVFCGDAGDIVHFKGKLICSNCISEIGASVTA
ncbi:AbrB/MazE/SpoVT family DNA-binding domain-containing protein [Brevibacillus humidisoli]|uniref:AbrB/MazE/SpoVT family DNA-binding domain-containing protein n=1 Tax=Brevibacillus humidisoli TaxID=2895522 RepID=UPI001E2CD45B|nr:AbrB/MazE/SpoVT family DNA-binding domain-containing protein [Brevibacillus humidisoli]UFJ43035.1 AbrB/MazE/SpoVT family DNA-binding domain-containing protein [Brevibacillus humidisoli]